MPDRVVDHEARRQITELAATLMALKERIDREGMANAAALNALADRVSKGEVIDATHGQRLALIGMGAASMFSALGGVVVWLVGKAFGGGP